MNPPTSIPKPVSGHDHLLEQLAQRYRYPLIAFFVRRVRSSAEAEDLTQEVFLRMVRRLGVSNVENVEAFLFRTAVNLLRDRSRRGKTLASRETDFAQRHGDIDDLTPERLFDSRQSLSLVVEVLWGLDERTRDAFILHRLEGMKHAQIAEVLGVSVSSVEKYIVKALAALVKRSGARP